MSAKRDNSWVDNIIICAKKHGINSPKNKVFAAIDLIIFLLNDRGSNREEIFRMFKLDGFLICKVALASCFVGNVEKFKECIRNEPYFDEIFKNDLEKYIEALKSPETTVSLISKIITSSNVLVSKIMEREEKIGRISESFFGINHTIRDVMVVEKLIG